MMKSLILSACFVLTACGGGSGASNYAPLNEVTCVSRPGFEALRTGMSYGQAVAAMGCEGVKTGDITLAVGNTPTREETYFWGKVGSEWATVVFKDSALNRKGYFVTP